MQPISATGRQPKSFDSQNCRQRWATTGMCKSARDLVLVPPVLRGLLVVLSPRVVMFAGIAR